MPKIDKDVSLALFTTFKIGGVAEYFSVANNKSELVELLSFAKKENLPVTVIGGGSNVLVSDDGIQGLVIKNNIGEINYEEHEQDVVVRVGAGVVFDNLVSETVAKNFWGLENLSHIPGSVGATPIQNVGAYGVEISGVINSVKTIDVRTSKEETFTNQNCKFGYRDSFFKSGAGKHFIVTEVEYSLRKNGLPQISYKDLEKHFANETNPSLKSIRGAVIQIRSQKFPDWNKIGTAGSFFKNPIISKELLFEVQIEYPDIPAFNVGRDMFKVSAGWLLDSVCDLRGSRQGQVGTYERQALVVINYGNATAEEVTNFAKSTAKKLFEKTNIILEWEVTKLGR